MEGREREGPKLLLNQGPSEPCYATGLRRNSAQLLPAFVVWEYDEMKQCPVDSNIQPARETLPFDLSA